MSNQSRADHWGEENFVLPGHFHIHPPNICAAFEWHAIAFGKDLQMEEIETNDCILYSLLIVLESATVSIIHQYLKPVHGFGSCSHVESPYLYSFPRTNVDGLIPLVDSPRSRAQPPEKSDRSSTIFGGFCVISTVENIVTPQNLESPDKHKWPF